MEMEIKLGELSNKRVKHKIDMIEKQDISSNEIAIIGLACRFAQTDSQDEYWDAIKNGVDCIRSFPKERQKLNNPFLKYSRDYSENDEYCEGGFLNDVDKFDNDFFNISPIEAKATSPQQREFLKIAWSAIEDAGYGGKKLMDSNTGVFLGYSTDFGVSYKEYIDLLNKDMEVLAVAGNLNSIIASRISYILNLKGPSKVIDTACSSSLVAVKTACDSILNGECDMAIAGSIKLDLLPLQKIIKKEVDIGITSKEGRTRAFDNDANGTGAGEGVAAIMLKPLKVAIKDRDQIYAIIKGSAINQDGKSVNLTSPNPLAQEKVIIQAWKNAKIDPKTISYIEAHGTGTRLGDPIEFTGINNAFRSYTTKQQFCGIGSIKTNIGHLDCAAGMASLIKLVLSLKHKVLPPSIHFKYPNLKIDFEESALYVNDSLRPWTTQNYPRRCGASAFGLSGTNCHIILEESLVKREIVSEKDTTDTIRVATFSAKTQEALSELIWKMGVYIRKNKDIPIDDVCYTLNTGRGQYEFKLAIIFQDVEELFWKINMVLLNGLSNYIEYDVFYGEHHIINSEQKKQTISEITEWERNQLSTKVNEQIKALINGSNKIDRDWLKNICIHYCSGAEVMWEELYANSNYHKVSLPTYPFARKSFWIEQAANIEHKTVQEKSMSYPLFQSCLAKSFDRITYESHFSPKKDWILSDHKVAGKYVVPGTTYLEMVRYVLDTYYQPKEIQLNNVYFLRPLVLSEEESAKVHTIINISGDTILFTIASKKDNENEWVIHAEGQAEIIYQNHQQRLDLELIKGNMQKGELAEIPYEESEKIETGARWDNQKEVWIGEHEVLAKLSLKNEFIIEANQFGMHPALLDEAANLLIRCIGKGLYLPYSYKGIRIKEHFSSGIYAYVKEKKKKEEFALFDVIIMDDSGNVLANINDYMIRKVNTRELTKNFTDQTQFHHFIWKEKLKKSYSPMNDDKCIVFVGKGKTNQEIAQYYEKLGCTLYNMPKTELEFTRVLDKIDLSKNHKVLYLLPQFYQSYEQNNLEYRLENSLYQFQEFIFALNKSNLSARMDLIVMGYYGVEFNENETVIPEYAAVYSYANGIRFEIPKINCYCIDLEEQIKPFLLNLNEIDNNDGMFLSAYRNGKKYIRCLTQYQLDMLNKSSISIEKGHTYIITGGMGALGLECVKYIASKQQARFVLVGRKGIQNAESNPQIKKQIQDIKDSGSEIIIENGDVSNIDFLDGLFEKVSNQYGKINGIFHLAGVAGDRFIKNKTEKEIDQVLLPKIQGTWNIDQLNNKYRFDFVVFFSSISSIVAEAGQVDYAAANAYMDGFAAYGRKKGRNYYSINWPAWSETGMAVQYDVDLEKQIIEPITTQHGFSSLEKILERELISVIVGKFNVNEYVENSSNLFDISPDYTKQYARFLEKPEKIENKCIVLEGREKNDSYSMIEQQLGEVIGRVLQIDTVNIFEEFVEMGLNSIISVKFEMELEKAGFSLSINDLFEYNSVKLLASHIQNENEARTIVEAETEKSNLKDIIVPFNDIFYISCYYNALIPVISKVYGNLYPLISGIIHVYSYKQEDPFEENELQRASDVKVMDLLQYIGLNVSIKQHVSHKKRDWILNDIDLYAVKDMEQYMGDIPEYETKDVEFALEDIITALKKKHPVILMIDCFFDSKRMDTYQKEHWLHALLLVDLDEEKQEFYVIEHSFKEIMNYKLRKLTFKDVIDSYEGYLINYQPEKNIPGFYEFILEEPQENDNRMELSEAQNIYRKLNQNHIEKFEDSIKQLGGLIQRIKEFINNKDSLEKMIESIVVVLGSCISRRQVDLYNVKKLYGEDNTLSRELQEIVNGFILVRKVLLRYQLLNNYDEIDVLQIESVLDDIYKSECNWISNWRK